MSPFNNIELKEQLADEWCKQNQEHDRQDTHVVHGTSSSAGRASPAGAGDAPYRSSETNPVTRS
jgi:hypothetical protein